MSSVRPRPLQSFEEYLASKGPRLTRAQQDRIYRRERVWFLVEHPFCEVRLRKDGSIAPRKSKHPICGVRSKQVHHIRKRGKWYLAKEFWLATGDPECSHHAWIEANGDEAERLGYAERIYGKH